MADQYGTSFDVMSKAAQSVQQTVEEIRAEMSSLESNLAPVASAWKGSAASAFQQLMERFNADGQKLTEALNAIGEAMGANTKNYSQVEDANASSISKILNALQ
jgi:WXG100 family type VII secretion target